MEIARDRITKEPKEAVYKKIRMMLLPMSIELLELLFTECGTVNLNELYQKLNAISPEKHLVILKRLNYYVRHGFVKRTVKGVDNPPVYRITEYGRDVLNKFKELVQTL